MPDPSRPFSAPRYPRKICLGIEERYCNLACPKCLVHGPRWGSGFDPQKTITLPMSLDQVIRILEEVRTFREIPMITPSFWSEPLVAKIFCDVVREAHQRDIPISISTNGLLIGEKMAEFLVCHVDVVSVSIDAMTKETLSQVRGTDKLDRIQEAVFLLLRKRGEAPRPRIMVSFSLEKANEQEAEPFIEYWGPRADGIRVNGVYTPQGWVEGRTVARQRLPCREVFDQLVIDYNGDVRICCLDGFRETSLGNVFREGVEKVWNGESFQRLRQSHLENDYRDQPFCGKCTLWSYYDIVCEKVNGNMLVRSSEHQTYYNRLDRLENWTPRIQRYVESSTPQ